MSLHYIIDGYNVIKQVTFLTGKKLQAGREGLVQFIERYRPQGSDRNEVTLVFDGKADVSGPDSSTKSVRVLFSCGQNADTRIKYIVEHARNPKRIVVVSDDKEIIFYCRSLGARVKSVKEFLFASALARPIKEQEDDGSDKPEPQTQAANEITEHLRKIWLPDQS